MTVAEMITERFIKVSDAFDEANETISLKRGNASADLHGLAAAIASIPQGGGEATITIVSPTTTVEQIADALGAAVSASITRFIAIRELPHGTNECIVVCWSASQTNTCCYRNDLSYVGMRRFAYGSNLAPVPQGAVFKIYGWGD